MRKLIVVFSVLGLFVVSCKDKQTAPKKTEPPVGAKVSDPAPAPVEPAGAPAKPAAPPAVRAEPKCDVASIRALRKHGNAQLKAGDAKAAVATFQKSECYFDEASDELARETAWLLSDYSYAMYKAGDYRGCHSVAESQLAPYPGNVAAFFEDDDKVMDALAHNATLCGAEIDKLFEGFTSTECTLGVEDATGVPPALLEAPVTAACLQVLPGTGHWDHMYEVGDVIWIQRAGGKITRRTFEGGLAGDDCNISEISFRKQGKSLQVLVAGEGRDCSGGTASSAFRVIHAIEAKGLMEVDGHYVHYH